MKAISNDNTSGLCSNCACRDFAPAVGYAIVADEVTFTSTSTFDAGDALAVLRASIFDKNGVEISTQTTADADTKVSIADLDTTKPLDFKVFLLTTGGCKADMALHNVTPTDGTSGDLACINK